MMNHFRAFVLFFSLLVVNASLATPNIESSPAFGEKAESAWILPAPSFVFLMAVGTDWSRISWTPVTGAVNYRIITTVAATGVIVNNVVVSAAINSIQLEPLPAGETLISTVYAIDQYGTQGLGRGVQYDTIIIETVGKYYPPNSDHSNACPVPIFTGSEFGCLIDWTGEPTYFKVTGSGNTAYFKTVRITAALMRIYAEADEGFTFENEVNMQNPACIVKYNGSTVARVVCQKNPNNGEVGVLRKGTNQQNNPSYTVAKIVYLSPFSNDDLAHRNFKQIGEIDLTPHLSATPNPFSDLLEVQIPFANEENELNLALYDLQGRMMMTQNIANGGSYQTIETGTLPTGVYFLRVECAGKAETIKVVKTQ